MQEQKLQNVYENAQMGKYMEELGFSRDHLSSIADGAPSSISKLDKLKVLEKSYRNGLEAFRQEHSAQLVEKIKKDENAPLLIKELIDENNITYVGFEKVVISSDYMPDHCVYIYLSGDILIGVQTADKSDTFDEIDYKYGDYDIAEAIYFDNIVNSNELIARHVTMEEGALAYKYLMNIMKKLEEQDRDTFRDYLILKSV